MLGASVLPPPARAAAERCPAMSELTSDVQDAGDAVRLAPLRLWIDDTHREAFVIQPAPAVDAAGDRAAAKSGPGGGRSARSARPVRRDLADGLLPSVEWDHGLIRQRCRVLLGAHDWTAAIVTAYDAPAKAYKVRLADGRKVSIGLPDHRIMLETEYACDPDTTSAADAFEEPPAGNKISSEQRSGQQGDAGAPSADGVGAGIPIGAASPCANSEASESEPVPKPYLSSLASTGFRYVRTATMLGGSDAFEVAFYVDGKEKNLDYSPEVTGPFRSAAAAASAYAIFALDNPIPIVFEDEEETAVRKSAVAAKAKSGGAASSGTSSGAVGGGAASKGAASSGGSGIGAQPKSKKAGGPPPIEYNESLVGRRVRALFEDSGEWYDGTITHYEPPRGRHGNGKYIVKYDVDDEDEEVTLPDDTVRILPVQAEDEPPPPLTKEEEKRSYKMQAQIAERLAKVEIEETSLQLHSSNITNTGYRCVYAIPAKNGLWAYEVKTEREGKKVNLGRFKSKLQAAVVFAKFTLTSMPASGGRPKMSDYGNMLIQQPMPDAMDGGNANTLEKVLDMRDVEIEVDAEGQETVVRVIGGTASGAADGDGDGNESGGEGSREAPSKGGLPSSPQRRVLTDIVPDAKKAKQRHTKATLAAVVAGVPYEVGIIRRTKRSIAEAMQRVPDASCAIEVDESALAPVELAAVLFDPEAPEPTYQAPEPLEEAAPLASAGDKAGEDEVGAEAMEVDVEVDVGAAEGDVAAPTSATRRKTTTLRRERQYLVKPRCFSYARAKWMEATDIGMQLSHILHAALHASPEPSRIADTDLSKSTLPVSTQRRMASFPRMLCNASSNE